MALPALRLASDLVYGYAAFLLSFCGISLFGNWGSSGEHFWYPIACSLGAMTNLTFLSGYVAILRRRAPSARWPASLAFVLSLLVTFTLVLSTELNGLYPGHGLWVTGLLALSLGSWRATRSHPPATRDDRRPIVPVGYGRKKAVVAGVALLMVVIPIAITVVLQVQASLQWREDQVVIQENDVKIARDVDQQVTQYFADLSSSNAISQRYGKFIRLTGGGYHRRQSMLGGSMFSLSRRAVFENGGVDCSITVWTGPTKKLQVRTYPGMTGHSASLQISVTHPGLFHSVDQRDRTVSQHEEIDSLLDQLAGDDNGDVGRWLSEQKRSQPVAAFVGRALQRDEIDIQLKAIRLLRGSEPKHRITLPEEVVMTLLFWSGWMSKPVCAGFPPNWKPKTFNQCILSSYQRRI